MLKKIDNWFQVTIALDMSPYVKLTALWGLQEIPLKAEKRIENP